MSASPAPQGGQRPSLSTSEALDGVEAAAKALCEPTRAELLVKLREPFPPEAVGKLFRAFQKQPPNAPRATCRECGSVHATAPGIHLNYVGHAAVRQRLLLVDPLWTWEPLAIDEQGLPRFILNGDGTPMRLWIKLTVLGVTRLGVGSVDGGAFDAEKQLIGDALRNAAMSFGVALDLWSKDELESAVGEVDPDRLVFEHVRKEPKPKDTRPAAEKKLDAKVNTVVAMGSTKAADAERAEMGAAFGGSQEGAGSKPPSRKVLGLPVDIEWQSARWGLIGKNCADVLPGVPSTTQLDQKTWEWASLGTEDGERLAWLEALMSKARDVFKRDGRIPANLQSGVLAYDALQGRLATAPASEKEV